MAILIIGGPVTPPPDPDPEGSAALIDFYDMDPHRYFAGDATGSGNGLTANNPWNWNQVLANATEGMIIGALPGVCSRASTGARDVPAFNIPSGVTLVCQRAASHNTDGRTRFTNGVTSGDNGSSTIGFSGKTGARFIGGFIDENLSRSTSDTGPVTVWNSTNCEALGLRIVGVPLTRNDNHNLFRVEQTTGWALKNSHLSNCRRSDSIGNQNYGAFMSYDSLNGLIDNCEFDNNDFHLFPKGIHVAQNGNLIVRNSKFTNALGGWMHLGGNNSHPGIAGSRFHNNLIIGAPLGINFHSFGSASVDGHPNDNLIDFNTFINVAKMFYWGWGPGSVPHASDCEILNNIFSTSSGSMIHDWVELTNADLARVIGNGTRSNSNHANGYSNFANLGGTAMDLAAWRTRTASQGATWEASTTQGNPLFVDAANGDYRVQSGSPAAGKGYDPTGAGVIRPGLERAA